MEAVLLRFPDTISFTDDELLAFCEANHPLRIERTSQGDILIMSPSGWSSEQRSLALAAELVNWNRHSRLGRATGSSGGYLLPNGAMRAPDVAWVENARWKAVSKEQREKLMPLCPDFVAEVRSKTDRLNTLREKMREWMANGCRLGWLIDPYKEKAYVYRADGREEVVASFDARLSGEDVLPGFAFDLSLLRDV